MDEALAVYLPMDRRHALAEGRTLPKRTQGAALFTDISGFTPLTEALTRELGPRRGAEELPRQLNLVYDALIREVDRYGGSVIGFAGDAITCWFDGDSSLRAVACGLAMQEAMRAFATLLLPSGGTASLAMKVALATGSVRRFLVGEERVQRLDVLAGATLMRMASAEHIAQKGELVLDEASALALGELLDIAAWRTDEAGARFAVVAGLRAHVSPRPWSTLAPGSLRPADLRPWLLPLVYERLQAGQGEFLTELRPAVALFLRFAGLDYDADPEAGERLDRFICWVQGVLVQYEGTLIQLTIGEKGSYLYAAFGAPIAHEDDARRAALTALALRTPPQELSFITEIQMGLTRGTMRTGAYGGRTRRTYGSLGDEVNLAARLMQHARPGQILATKRVQAATEALFSWQPLDEIRVKGKTQPIPVFALLGQVQTPPIHLTEPTYTLPMIGRQTEFALIEAKLALVHQGQGQIVGITGEAGMGKSRLVAEVIRHAQAQGVTGYGGECQSYGTNTPYLVWQSILRAFFGLVATDPQEHQHEQLVYAVTELEPALLPRLPLLGPILNLSLPDNELTRSLDPHLRKASREALLVDLLKHRARRLAAVLLVLEDCHWLDPLSQDLLEAVGRSLWNLPVLILLAYRPPELERPQALRVTTLPHFTAISLTELDAPEAVQVINQRLTQLHPAEERLPPTALLRQLTERAQGNPFYLEELLNYLHDQGLDPYDMQAVEQFELPNSLHSLILSRIDRLTEPQKVTLKVASIIGRLFRLSWLLGYYPSLGEGEGVKGDLEALRRLDLTPLERPEPELTYLFKHVVTREVAYESLPYATRAYLHEQLATYLEQQGSAQVDGYLDLLAYHYALSENKGQARLYLRLAAEAAQASYANLAALDYYERLLALLEPKEGVALIDLLLKRGGVLERMGRWEEAHADYQQALERAARERESLRETHSQLAIGSLLQKRGDYEAALGWLTQAHGGFERLRERHGLARTLVEIGYVFWRWGQYNRARSHFEASLALAQEIGDERHMALALHTLGNVLYFEGEYRAARARWEESRHLRVRLEDKPGLAITLNNLGLAACELESASVARTFYTESLTLSRMVGNQWGIALSLGNLGNVSLMQGEVAEAQRLHEASLVLRQESGDRWGMAIALCCLGFVALTQQNYPLAQERHAASLALAQEIGDKQITAYNLVGLADLVWQQAEVQSGKMQCAVWLSAGADRLTAALGAVLEPIVRIRHERTLMETRARLGEEAFLEAWQEGQRLRVEDILAYALEDTPLGAP